MQLGLVHIYCGDGKGKTTAALGLALRALGHGYKVLLVQFLKSQDTGELKVFDSIPNTKVLRSREKFGFTFQMTEEQKKRCIIEHNKLLEKAREICSLDQIDLIILDEIISAYNYNLVNRAETIKFLKEKPKNLEVVLTGRDPAAELLQFADYISEIKKIKHPFDRGITARTGVEK